MADVRPGDLLEALVERVVPGGAGLARTDGVVTLVAGALPGDRVRALVEEASPRLIRGRVDSVLAPGPARRPDAEICPLARTGACGGCDWPAARLEFHRELKTQLVLDALRRLGGFSPDDLPEPRWLGSPVHYRLRNRLHLSKDGRLGFFAQRSNVVSDLEGCEIVSMPFLARLPALRAHLRSMGPLEGELLTLESRDGSTLLGELRLGSGEGLQIPSKVKEAGRGPFDGLRVVDSGGCLVAANGPSELVIEAGGARFSLSVSSFFQGNLFLLDAFQDEIRAALRAAGEGNEDVLRRKGGRADARPSAVDLYAGVGFMTRPLLELAREAGGGEVTAVEIEPSAANSLSRNLSAWHREGLPLGRSVRASAESFFHSQKSLPLSLLVADPPRAGLSPEVRKGILRLAPPHVLMVSCDPPTLARDLAALKDRYRPVRLTLLDLFPRTHHVETVVLLAARPIG